MICDKPKKKNTKYRMVNLKFWFMHQAWGEKFKNHCMFLNIQGVSRL
jgi:hypothetical protein